MSEPKKESKPAKKKMKLWLKIVLSILVVLLVAVIALIIWRDWAITKSIRHFGTEATGTRVDLDSFSSSLLGGRVTLKQLAVANPEGYRDPSALQFELLTVKLDPASLFTDTIVVEEIIVDGLAVDFEAKAGLNLTQLISLNIREFLSAESNLTQIQKNIEHYAGSGQTAQPAQPQPKPAETAESKPSKQVVIKLLSVKNTRISFSSSFLASTLSIPLPDFETRNIGEQKSLEDAIQVFFETLYEKVGLAVYNYLKENGPRLLSGLGGALTEGTGAIGGAVRDGAGAIGIGNLFGGKED